MNEIIYLEPIVKDLCWDFDVLFWTFGIAFILGAIYKTLTEKGEGE